MMPPPDATISSASLALDAGLGTSTPEPITAQVRPPAARVRWCANVSIPAAKPDITAKPAWVAPFAASSATIRPKPVGRRLPTIATEDEGGRAPRTQSVFGGDGIERNASG